MTNATLSPTVPLDAIADNLPVMVAYLDREQHYRYVNRIYEELHRRPREQIVGLHVRELIGEAAYGTIRPHIERALAGEAVTFEMAHDYPDGVHRVLRVDYRPDVSEGAIRGLVAHIADISAKHRAEAALHLKEQAITHALDGMAMADLDGRLIYVNPAFLRLWGYRGADQVLGRPATSFWVEPDAAAGVVATLMQAGQWQGDLEALRADGSRFRAGLHAGLIRDAQGRPSCMVASFQDLTDRLEAFEQAELFQRIAEATDQGIGYADLDATVSYFNPALRRMLAVPQDADLSRYSINDFYPAEQVEMLHRHVLPTVRERGRWSGEVELRALDGRVVPTLHNVLLLRCPDGTPRAYAKVITDLTERRRQEETLRRERNFTAAVLDNAGALVVVLDREGRIRRFNRACEELSRYGFAEVEGRRVWDFLLPPEEREAVGSQAFEALVRDPQARLGSYTNQWLAKDGERRLIEWHNTVLRDERGALEYVVAIGIDVTEKRQVEEALKRSEETYARAEAIAHIGSWDWDIATGGLRWTDEIYRIFGRTPRSFGATYEAFLAAVHPDDRQRVIDAVNASVADPAVPYDVEHRVVRPDGRIRSVRERGRVYRDEQGRPLRMIGTVHDITEQKRVEAELERHRAHLEELVRERTAELAARERQLRRAQEIAHLGHWSVNVQTGELDWSDEIYRIFGREPRAYTPTRDRFYEAVHPEDLENLLQAQAQAFAQGVVFRVDHRIVLPDGGIRWVHEEAVAERDAEGRPLRLTGTVQDITARKAAEEELLRAKQEAEQANRAKSEFLARMSHELRTPMNAILGFTQVLEMQPLSSDQREFVAEIHRAGDHLLALIDELLDLSRIEAVRLAVNIATVQLGPLMDQAMQLVRPLISGRGLSLTIGCLEDLAVLADAMRLRQVLVNLLSNAAKYNREGGHITLECRTTDGERLRLAITDTGPGIPPEKQAGLFLPFERLGAESSEVDGTGIGLALCKQLMELMGGSIGVEAAPGQGATFWIELPLARAAASARPPAQAAEASTVTQRCHVLCMEDNAANLRLVETILQGWPNMSLLSATNGEYGLELARRYRPDIILMDIHLPGRDGYTVLEALQADAGTRDIPVIALSADAMPLDVERGLKAGFKAYLTKPVNIEDLLAALRAARAGRS